MAVHVAWELSGSANGASHGWGSRAAVDLLSDVLGIDLAAPGGSELSITIPDTGLTEAEGRGPRSTARSPRRGGATSAALR